MSEQIPSKRDLELANKELVEANDALLNKQTMLENRITKMEDLVSSQKSDNTYTGPAPEVYHDPYDVSRNPHHVMKHPDGKVLSWKNPAIRNGSRGWRGWVPVTYDDEIGLKIKEYIPDPPAKMAGSAAQDNYIRRGTDSILCWLPEEMFKARQMKRESQALNKQLAAQSVGNHVLRPGVETFGDGVQQEQSPPGGFKMGNSPTPSLGPNGHRTNMFEQE